MLNRILLWAYIGTGVLSITAFTAGIGLGYLRVLGPGPAFGLFAIGMLTGLIGTLSGFIDLVKNGSGPRSLALVAALIPALALVYGAVSGREFPVINDISTDLTYPPSLNAAAELPENADRDMTFPAENKPLIQEHYADLEPLATLQSIDEVHTKAAEVIASLSDWEITSTDITPETIIVEGTVTSGVFGFVDDFSLRLKKPQGGGCVVDMRSKSRLGKGDFGQNAAHIRQLFGLMEL